MNEKLENTENEALRKTAVISRSDLHDLLMSHLNKTVFKNGETPEQKQQMFELFQEVTGMTISDDLDAMEEKVKNGVTLESLKAELEGDAQQIADEVNKIPSENFEAIAKEMRPIVFAEGFPKQKICKNCGHPPCTSCGDWCDVLLYSKEDNGNHCDAQDDDDYPALCCGGQCEF